MKAMILAAGEGTRLRPLTYDLPKPMIPVVGKPVMEYLIELLFSHRIKDIMVNVSHLPEAIESYFADGRRWGVNIGYSYEGHIRNGELHAEPLGSAGGIKRIQEFGGIFDDTFIVVCGDAIIDLDLTEMMRKHWQSGNKASIIVKQVEEHRIPNYGVVDVGDSGQVLSFQEKPSVEEACSDLVSTGIYIFEPEIIDCIPSGKVYDIGSDLLPDLLRRKVPFGAINMPFRWLDIGRLSDYWTINQQLMRGSIRGVNMPGTEVLPKIWVGLNVDIDWDHALLEGPVYIGSNSRVEAGCVIQGPTWISHGCHLQAGARISRSLLFKHTLMRGHAEVNDAVVFGERCVDKNGNPFHSESGLEWAGDARDQVLRMDMLARTADTG